MPPDLYIGTVRERHRLIAEFLRHTPNVKAACLHFDVSDSTVRRVMQTLGVRLPHKKVTYTYKKGKPQPPMADLAAHKKFISQWQHSRTMGEFLAVSGLTAREASNEAAGLRRRGVALRKMPAGKFRGTEGASKRVDWEALRLYAANEWEAARLKERYRK